MIYIITHKTVNIKYPEWKGYQLLHVGGSVEDPICQLMDNSGDNISEKNKSFCELTGLYWIWKNHKEDSVVGLVHYRRYFVYPVWYKIAGRIPIRYRMISRRKAKKLLREFDIIVPNPFRYQVSVWENYKKEHQVSDLYIIRSIIQERYGDYLDDFDRVFQGNEMYGCNMFISTYEFVDKYCTWLFGILFEAERRIDISLYSDYQKRVFGFLAERLFNVYIRHNHLKVFENVVDFIEI